MKGILWQRRYIWLVVACGFLTAYFHRTVTGVVADNLMRDFGIGQAAELGILSSIYFYTYALLQVPAGLMADRYGPRKVIAFTLIISTVGALLVAKAETMEMLYIGRFLSSVGVSFIYVNMMKLQAEWFQVREFATMSGLLTLFGGIGSLLTATPLAVVVELLNWKAAFYIIGGYSLIMALFTWWIVRDRPNSDELPVIKPIVQMTKREGIEELKPNIWAGMALVMRNSKTWPPFIAAIAFYGVYMSFSGIWGVPYFMQVHHMDRVTAANHLLTVALGNMVGAPLVGFFSDRLARRKLPFLAAGGLFLVTWLLLTFWNDGSPPMWSLYPLCFFIGLGVSGLAIVVACGKEVNPPELTGVTAGFINSGPFIGAALMQPAFGWVLDQYWQGEVWQGVKIYSVNAYQHGFGLCTLVLVVGVCAVSVITDRLRDA